MPAGRADLASLEERLGLLTVVRLALAAVVMAVSATMPARFGLDPLRTAPVVSVYAALALGAGLLTRRDRSLALRANGVLLAVDGVWLLVVTAPSGGAGSQMMVLWSVYLVAVALLGSGRDALRLVAWEVGLLLLPPSVLGRIDSALGAASPRPPGAAAVVVAAAGLCAVAATTVACARVAERELRRNRRELEVLAAMAAALEEAPDPGAARAVVLRHVAAALEVDRAAMVVADGPHLVLDPSAPAAVATVPAGQGRAGALVAAARDQHRPIPRRRLGDADGAAAALLPGARNVVAAAIGSGADAPVLLVEHGGRPEGERVARRTLLVLGQFTTHAALAFATASLLAEREREAGMDDLTGLANRRHFDRALRREVAIAARRGDRLSLVMLDVDHFKAINDRLGHPAGDRVLRHLAEVLRSVCRDMDLVARYGGEEFVLLLPLCSSVDALCVVRRVENALASDTALGGITVSAGVATLWEHADDGAALVAAADAALYEAKRAGRARAVVARTRDAVEGGSQIGAIG